MLYHLFTSIFFIKLNPTVVNLAIFKFHMWLHRYIQQNSSEGIPGYLDNQDTCLYTVFPLYSGAHTFGARYITVGLHTYIWSKIHYCGAHTFGARYITVGLHTYIWSKIHYCGAHTFGASAHISFCNMSTLLWS